MSLSRSLFLLLSPFVLLLLIGLNFAADCVLEVFLLTHDCHDELFLSVPHCLHHPRVVLSEVCGLQLNPS